jgi:hypothetical protein
VLAAMISAALPLILLLGARAQRKEGFVHKCGCFVPYQEDHFFGGLLEDIDLLVPGTQLTIRQLAERKSK